MEREVSHVTTLAVMLISMAIVLNLVMFTVRIGNETKQEAINYGTDIAADLQSGELSELRDNCEDLPMASIYSILTRNFNNISEVAIYDCMTLNNADTLKHIDDFVRNCSYLHTPATGHTSSDPSGAKIYRANSSAMWTVNGADGSGPAMCSEIMVQYYNYSDPSTSRGSMLSGRGYITANLLKDGTYCISILKYQ